MSDAQKMKEVLGFLKDQGFRVKVDETGQSLKLFLVWSEPGEKQCRKFHFISEAGAWMGAPVKVIKKVLMDLYAKAEKS